MYLLLISYRVDFFVAAEYVIAIVAVAAAIFLAFAFVVVVAVVVVVTFAFIISANCTCFKSVQFNSTGSLVPNTMQILLEYNVIKNKCSI